MTVLGVSLAAVALRAQTPTVADTFRPGEPIYDTAGKPINAHWGSMLRYYDVYYWFGGIMDGKTVNQHVPLPGGSCY